MSAERLSRLIEDFSYRNLNLFFREKCENYAETQEDLSQYDDEKISDFQKLGEIRFDSGDKLVITSSLVSDDLNERSGKKAQYEKAKKILKEMVVYDAGFFIFHDNTGSFRFSLVYAQFQGTKRSFSNFRRFTYFVSKDQTNKTFRIRVGGCTFLSLESIKDAFSVEKVNKEFYNHIARFFYRLTGYECKREMTLAPVSDDDKETYQKFAVRLIGRTIFCWFLKHKKSVNGISLIPESILSSEAVRQNSQYYHATLEKLFFEVLNTPQEQRHKNILQDVDKIPFLNGGLFEPHKDDFYSGKPLYNLVIPDTWFEQFFEILEQYNFTIDENSMVDADVSVDPEMLGRIFENLLAEVNPETGETARKATGSYYTPRNIVDYMVDQSLKKYLLVKTGVNEDTVTSLLSYEIEEISLNDEEKGSIIAAFDQIKIIDPACGSGAFPMGILHKMLVVLQKVDPDLSIWLRNHLGKIEPGIFRDQLLERIKKENWEYVRKLLIIQNSIYGVDIQTIAVEISKLRFFLSLIVEEKIDDTKENRGVEALPNLEFKFVAANSLIGLPPAINRQIGFGGGEEIDRLKELRNNYLRSYGQRKKLIEEDFRQTRGKLIEHAIKWGGKDALALQLANWDPFSNEASNWFDPEWMFGISNGFDIAIANPPYIFSREKLTEQDKAIYRRYYSLTQFKINLYILFIEKSFNLLNDVGNLVFITPNNWLTLSTNSDLRYFLLTKTKGVCIILNYDKVFEKSSVDTCILIFAKIGDSKMSYYKWTENEVVLMGVQRPEHYLNKSGYVLGDLDHQASNKGSTLCDKLNSQSTMLSDLAEVKNGVQAYTVGEGNPIQTEEMKINRIYHGNIQKSKAWIKYLDGVDVSRYRTGWSGQFIKYGQNLTRPRKPDLFIGERLLVRQIPGQLPYCIHACYTEEHTINDNNIMIIKLNNNKIHIKYLLGVINSKLISFWFAQSFGKLQRKIFPQFKVKELRIFPIKLVSNQYQRAIVSKVDQILNAKKINPYADTTTLERQIDQMVYELYGLTPEEIAVVEGSSDR